MFGAIGGSAVTGAFNAWQAGKNRKFQERMSNTAYQRSAKDLEKAGLNRILALGSPSSTPAGASATMPDLGSSVSSGRKVNLEAKMNKEQIQVAQTQQQVNSAQAAKLQAEAERERWRLHLERAKGKVWEKIGSPGAAAGMATKAAGSAGAAATAYGIAKAIGKRTPQGRVITPLMRLRQKLINKFSK